MANARASRARDESLAGSSPAPGTMSKDILAYVIGVAIGDGNLSNPNGRAVRLRITCDAKYPGLIIEMSSAIQRVMPDNKVSLIRKKETAVDISCYSNKWEDLLGWRADGGSKYRQNVSIPPWIMKNKRYSVSCLRGLLQTDGTIYLDRGYRMVMFVTIIKRLADDVMHIISSLDFHPRAYGISTRTRRRYNIRLSQDVDAFIKRVRFYKN